MVIGLIEKPIPILNIFYMNILEKAQLTASICHIGQIPKIQIIISIVIEE